MKAIEKLYITIAQHFPDERVTTTQIANVAGLTRGVTSSYLSQLAKEGKLLKTGGRPVYWQIKRERSAFDDLIGVNGSLSTNIQKAITAIVYPTNGLPIFLTGPAGSGKLPFSRAIFHEAIRRKVIHKTAFFEIIDYANYKNHFDDFMADLRTKIVHSSEKDNTDDGYLYISNLQMLQSSDQQYLFSHASQQKNTNTRLIYSSTTKIFAAAQGWFKSAAIKITLSDFANRPLNERISLVARYLQQQADQINKKILITPNKLIALANFTHPNNITELSNHIQLLCAKAYARTPENSQLVIGTASDNAISIFPKQHTLQTNIKALTASVLQLGPTIDNLYKKLADSLLRGESITEQDFLVTKVLNQMSTIASDKLVALSSQSIQKACQSIITKRYGVVFPSKSDPFWHNIARAFLFAGTCSDNLSDTKVTHQFQVTAKRRYPRSYYLYKKFLMQFMPQKAQNAYYYLPFFLLFVKCEKKIDSVNYNAILLAHGENTASSIQKVVNSLCGNYFFEAFDMPIDITLSEINIYVQHYLSQQDPSAKGNIVLFDMGSLRQMFSEIKKVSNQELIVVNNMTTAMALDIGLRIQRNDTFQSIAEAGENFGASTNAQYYEGLSNQRNIIVSCMSGVGLSEELKKLLDDNLSPSLEVITLDYKKLHTLLTNNDRKFFANTQLILTTTNVSDDISIDIGIDIVNVYNVFDKASSLRLQTVLLQAGESQESINKLIDQLIRFLSIEGIRGRLQILNPDIVIQESQDIVAHYENFYNVKFESKLKLNLYMHLSLMFERMMTSNHSNISDMQQSTLPRQEQDFFSLSSGIFQPVEQKFNIKVEDYEIDLLYQLLKDYIF
ncbi:transcriptional activator [Lactobacillus selangorensis]|uniref:Transcriptional activator n=1 Tax=Lactobacillus selangorensis TaxID=81857 RepID=A0A0R2FTF2_9LACO|nr:PRD domain-containing protein [Lactobacillus selangorensis]KRN28004.1 transcriptional activator [Lactobacillus selangorensis]KRN30525.1 transcriptional activator [Lactobacillus selangorensis]